jgi:hypothetical protein
VPVVEPASANTSHPDRRRQRSLIHSFTPFDRHHHHLSAATTISEAANHFHLFPFL